MEESKHNSSALTTNSSISVCSLKALGPDCTTRKIRVGVQKINDATKMKDMRVQMWHLVVDGDL